MTPPSFPVRLSWSVWRTGLATRMPLSLLGCLWFCLCQSVVFGSLPPSYVYSPDYPLCSLSRKPLDCGNDGATPWTSTTISGSFAIIPCNHKDQVLMAWLSPSYRDGSQRFISPRGYRSHAVRLDWRSAHMAVAPASPVGYSQSAISDVVRQQSLPLRSQGPERTGPKV